MNIIALVVSNNSLDPGKLLPDIYPNLEAIIDLISCYLRIINKWINRVDVVFICTDHKVSHDLARKFLTIGCIFDLFDIFRCNNQNIMILSISIKID
ncbi:hypothetical protein [Pantoea sp. Mhis]|uniref:hypothetical protein n=1 Tax=Pantoea sp. Mhis TaxID=2576759 RepID=UPI001357541A|nr:hypothetical protein [Pantoea sp. Mhis]